MSAIFGYLGRQHAIPIIINGLELQSYRGYDSAGIVLQRESGLEIEKTVGKLNLLAEQVQMRGLDSTIGIGHTRWATHGRPTVINAHPHTDGSGQFAVVQNGIIENYLSLREGLEKQGHCFKSDTDAEVLPHLLAHYYRGDLVDAVRQVLQLLEGSYSFVALCKHQPNRLVAAAKNSPLFVGLGEGESFLSSDIPALQGYTRQALILGDGEMADLSLDGVRVLGNDGQPTDKQITEIVWQESKVDKGGFDHFMLKEIHDQPRAVRDVLSGRINSQKQGVLLKELDLDQAALKNINRIYITACGTAYHAGMVGKHIIESLARLPVEVDIASEFRYRNPLVDDKTLLIVVSQSGETADTLAALREAKRLGAKTLAITNVESSTMSREADYVIPIRAGRETAIASTKAYTNQLVCMQLLGMWLAQELGTITPQELGKIILDLEQLDGKIVELLQQKEMLKALAERFKSKEQVFYIGRGLDHVLAMEGALKLKETTYIHAEPYAAGELKHGTLALVEENTPMIALATQEPLLDKMISNIKEVKARGAKVTAVAMAGSEEVAKVADQVFYIPTTHPLLAPVLTVVPLQLLAYYTSLARGCDVDNPRNLAKSVTVE